jgi:tetratricopeptide (TPR) repeat protein
MKDQEKMLYRKMTLTAVWSVFLTLVLVVAFSTEPLHAQTLDTAEVMELYRQAREMFRQANETAASDPEAADQLYRKALMRYEKIVWEGGIRNGKLFYNIGNTYFKIKDLGRAILNYKRAALFIPNDPNLRQNLEFAKARRIDRIEEPQKIRILKILFFWHYDFSTHTRVILFSVFGMLFWIFAGFRLFFSKRFVNRLIVFSAGLAFLFLTSLIADMIHQQKNQPGVIISPEVIARKGDSETYERSFKEPIHSGTEFILIEKRGNWYNIELLDARRCWVPEPDAELVMKGL